MRRLIIHLFVAMLTFAFGIVASMLWGGFLAPSVKKVSYSVGSVSSAPVQETALEPLQSRCGCSQIEEQVSTGAEVPEQKLVTSGGVLNGKAISLPKPDYPAIARAARASGTVTVQIVIDGRGCIESAHAIGGHPLLQAAATQAAQQACFTPTLLSGQPVKVKGVITYNFVAQ